ncbi:EAL domain-containing protein [Parasphingorhabdus sp.]|uniref:EAL domain-containing protein n=1 Tax=Parasphingorhabdus sp. TaxID=2709688 RepID=UPI0032F05917
MPTGAAASIPRSNLPIWERKPPPAEVRWYHPERGIISPDIFIPLLEQAGRIDGLTYHVLQLALDDVAGWSGRLEWAAARANLLGQYFGHTFG